MAAAAYRTAVGKDTEAALAGRLAARVDVSVQRYVHAAASRRGYVPLNPAAILATGPCASIDVVRCDTLVAAADLIAAGERPIVLNMASFSTPGGGFLNGAGTQEEELCRRTTVYPSLMAAAAQGAYPIPLLGLLFHGNVSIIRGAGPGYGWLTAPYPTVAMLSCPAVRRPELINYGRHLSEPDAFLTTQKIELMLAVAATHGYNVLLLGAMGCGTYKNPPSHVARLFASVLAKYGAGFKHVRFAIIDGGPTAAGESNYSSFAEVFP